MRKRSKILIISLVVMCIVAFTAGGIVYADDADKDDKFRRGPFMGERGHPGLISDVLGLTPEEIQAQLEDGKTIVEIAAEQGLTEEEFRAAMLSAMTGHLQQEVADGNITQEDADRILDRVQDCDGNGPCFGPRLGRGDRLGARIGPGGHADLMGDILGLMPEEIRAQLADGKTMAEIIADRGFSEEEFHTAMLSAVTEKLQQEVADGSISQEQADRFLDRMQYGPSELGFHKGRGFRGRCRPGVPTQ